MTRIIESLAELAGRYDALYCDLWGCVHDGLAPLPEAVEALRAFRGNGGKVVLVTNAPRPRAAVAEQIATIGVPEDCWDIIATSGDAARTAMFEGVVGRRVYHVGTPDEGGFFAPIRTVEHAVEIERVGLEDAEGIVCTGFFNPHDDPETMRPDFEIARDRGLELLCANPDIVVDRGEEREWCAGALARLYTEMGGESLYFGKPHGPLYDLARRRLTEVGGAADARILAVGDGIATDVKGGLDLGIDVLFISGGLARAETGTDRQPDPALLDRFLDEHGFDPHYTIGWLR